MSRTGQQEPAGSAIGVDGLLDRQQQLRYSLYLVDDQEGIVEDELRGVVAGRLPGLRLVEAPPSRADLPAYPCDQRALSALASPVDQDDASICERFMYCRVGMSGKDPTNRR
ncbi:hypothetical protein NS2_69040 [Nocardia seriolae NBRC 15557]|nr:hypothetical protein NS2_69040 [Nocardia seriolae NBRC 15557]